MLWSCQPQRLGQQARLIIDLIRRQGGQALQICLVFAGTCTLQASSVHGAAGSSGCTHADGPSCHDAVAPVNFFESATGSAVAFRQLWAGVQSMWRMCRRRCCAAALVRVCASVPGHAPGPRGEARRKHRAEVPQSASSPHRRECRRGR